MVKSLQPGITVCVPSIPPRFEMLGRALVSIAAAARNVYPGVPVQVEVAHDFDRRGAAATRQAALERVTTKWVTFLDDDDTMDPWHLRELYEAAHSHNADYLWSRFRIGFPDGRTQAGPSPLGAGTFEQWNDDQPAQTTVTTFVRTELALDVGGFVQPPKHEWSLVKVGSGYLAESECEVCSTSDPAAPCEINGQRSGEDWLFTLACRAAGATFRHVPKVTWTWNHHASNTSGLPSRW